MNARLTPSILRGLQALQTRAHLECIEEFFGYDPDSQIFDATRAMEREYEDACAAADWIRDRQPKLCAVCNKGMFGRAILNQSNKLVHPKCGA
jgi:hypothetical protein